MKNELDCKPKDVGELAAVIFSKNRALQLDGTLHSFYLHCQDPKNIQMNVLYLVTDDIHDEQYGVLQADYPEVSFIREINFKDQLMRLLEQFKFILFLVDDNLFVRPFSLQQIKSLLEKYPNALGYSLRLGSNTTYCYPCRCEQHLPDFKKIENDMLTYDWSTAELDFAYALEVSSSIYRTSDLLNPLRHLPYNGPNTLELFLSSLRRIFGSKRKLICSKESLTFCNPINKVQRTFNANRSGEKFAYSIEELCALFAQGERIDVKKYAGYLPRGCHEEVELYFEKIK